MEEKGDRGTFVVIGILAVLAAASLILDICGLVNGYPYDTTGPPFLRTLSLSCVLAIVWHIDRTLAGRGKRRTSIHPDDGPYRRPDPRNH